MCAAGSTNPPYPRLRAVMTHGFVLDGDGAKMSKSVGNVISPDDIITKEVCRGSPHT